MDVVKNPCPDFENSTKLVLPKPKPQESTFLAFKTIFKDFYHNKQISMQQEVTIKKRTKNHCKYISFTEWQIRLNLMLDTLKVKCKTLFLQYE